MSTHYDWRSTFGIIIDLGGDDVYENNAGGAVAGHLATKCRNGVLTTEVAILVDGGGNDFYGPAWSQEWFELSSRFGCGHNGGAAGGVGMLIDHGGDDVYLGYSLGVNGGSSGFGRGMILDYAGDDVYRSGGLGSNGGSYVNGDGMILDYAGNDFYETISHGGNGGVFGLDGTGRLVDMEGDDTYIARGAEGTNGAADGSAGSGLLLDGAGTDLYRLDWSEAFVTDQTRVPAGSGRGAQVDL